MNQPTTISEVAIFLLEGLDAESRTHVYNMRREDLIDLHHGFGTGIRNSLGLWSPTSPIMNDPAVKGMFPDDVSMLIIEQMWDYLHDNRLGESFI